MSTQILRIPQEAKSTILELASELKFASKSLKKREWLSLILKTASTAGRETLITKVEGIKDLGKYFTKKFKSYRRNPKRSSRRDLLMVKRRVSQLPENVQLRISQFRNLHRDKQCESAIVTTITLIIFFATMGGLDAEGGLLDLDRKFGMGKHRHIFSHSIILGFGVEFAMRFVLLFISAVYSRLPFSHNEIWNRIERIMQKTKKFGVAAVWAGIGVHLFKDSKIFLKGARIKPMVGVPGRHGMMFHKSLLATNSAVAETLGISSVKANK